MYQRSSIRRELHNLRITRREALSALLASAALTMFGSNRVRADSPVSRLPLSDRYLSYLAPYPAKRRLLLDYAGERQNLDIAKGSVASDVLTSSSGVRILRTNRWRSGSHPNYSDTALRDGMRHVWVACYDSRTVTQLNVTHDKVTSFGPFPQVRPLDVKYDARRDRLIVASADSPNASEAGQARMLVLDLANGGAVIANRDLALLTGQGPCLGGAQGVTVDAHGDYWFSLAYSGQLGRGIVLKMDGSTLEPSLILKNLAPNEPLEGLSNPNGITTGHEQATVFALSDTGRAHQFDLSGNLINRWITVSTGYRGAVHGDELWVAAWAPSPGAVARLNLRSGERQLYRCAPHANSLVIDNEDRVWIAGDEGLSVSDRSGRLLAYQSFGACLNGLSFADDHVFSTSYAYDWPYEDSLLSFDLGEPQAHLPAVLFDRRLP